jgi:membrane fusion protein (multidrug efflux system)
MKRSQAEVVKRAHRRTAVIGAGRLQVEEGQAGRRSRRFAAGYLYAFVAALPIVALLAGCEARDDERQQNRGIPVRTEVVKRSDFTPRLTMTGTVRAAESLPLVVVHGGRIRYAPRFRSGLLTGALVTAGEPLAEITNTQSESLLRQARLQMEAAESDYERADRSFKAGILSPAEHSSADTRRKLATEAWRSARTEADKLRVTAPRAGHLVVTRVVASGAQVDDGSILAEIASSRTPVVESAVADTDRALLQTGMTVAFTARGGQSWQGTGRVSEVASTLDANGTGRVVCAIDRGAEEAPVPGSGVELEISLGRHPDTITVPDEAIVSGADGAAVFVLAGAANWQNEHRVRRVSIQVGGRGGGRVEVRSGLRDGDRVVVAGADGLSDSTTVFEAGGKAAVVSR